MHNSMKIIAILADFAVLQWYAVFFIFRFLSTNDFSPFPLRCKKGPAGAHLVKSKTTMMVGIYDESKKAEEAAVAVESIVESLINANY